MSNDDPQPAWKEFLAAVRAALDGDSDAAIRLVDGVRQTHGPIVAQQQERELRRFINAIREGALVADGKGGYEAASGKDRRKPKRDQAGTGAGGLFGSESRSDG